MSATHFSLVATPAMIIGKGDETWKRHSIFRTRCISKGKLCTVVIDGGFTDNLVSQEMVDKLGLQTTKHSKPFSIQWFKKGDLVAVNHQCLVPLTIGPYEDTVMCTVVPMDVFNLLLGRPWQFDHRSIHDGVKNTHLFLHKGRKLILEPLKPPDIETTMCTTFLAEARNLETSKRMWLFNLYYSSWPLFALSHHFLVWYCAELVYPGREFRRYAVLGDDVVIADPLVAKRNEEALGEFQVEISRQKSLISSTGSFEFAKRFFVKNGSVDLSPISIRTLMSFMSPFGLMGISYPSLIKNLLRICGMGYKVIALLNHNASPKRVSSDKGNVGITRGLSSLSFEIWLGHSLSLSEGSSSGILAI
ncbi:hypothetical protein IFM89_019155 [Coptis chinensis]|uniref:Uncharacterized protein n=1 Tax=Coptis chinensis TaxID=261450 RepID=A0A835LC69_9MAGN|nr:hypothetical protein IFM89_019155 [Coptis chinensis]